MKIAISGPIGSGKTTLATLIAKNNGLEKKSFAESLKSFANKYLKVEVNGPKKDRKSLIEIGLFFRKFNEDVFIDMTVNENDDNIIIDDLRFKNEAVKLKKRGFFLIRLNIDRETQVKRIKMTYPEDAEKHMAAENDPSETDLNDYEDFDLVLDATSDPYENMSRVMHSIDR